MSRSGSNKAPVVHRTTGRPPSPDITASKTQDNKPTVTKSISQAQPTPIPSTVPTISSPRSPVERNSYREFLDVMATDTASRSQTSRPVTDLFSLDKINFNKDWDYSLPTMQSPLSAGMHNKVTRSIQHFTAAFNRKYSSYLSKVTFNNILIAGGCVGGILLGTDWNSDIDIFVHGLTVDQANKRVVELMHQLYRSYGDTIADNYIRQLESEGDKIKPTPQELAEVIATQSDVTSIRNKNCITIQFGRIANRRPNRPQAKMMTATESFAAPVRTGETVNGPMKVQIILRLYKNETQILHGFDMGSSAIGYNGTNVIFTSLGKFAYEYQANIVDPSRRSTTYEKRLIKYYHRGFHIILPNLNIGMLDKKNLKYGIPEVVELPYLTFSYRSVVGNKIASDRILKWGTASNGLTNEEFDSDYQAEELDAHKVFYLNLRKLVRHEGDYYYYSTTPDLNILTNPPYITPGKVTDFYDALEKKIYMNKGMFNIKTFKEYFSADLLPEVVLQLFVNKDTDYLTGLIQKQKEEVLSVLDTLQCKLSEQLQWITTNPGTQLTGSFNPIVSDPADWYGAYYIDQKSVKVERESKCSINTGNKPSNGKPSNNTTPVSKPSVVAKSVPLEPSSEEVSEGSVEDYSDAGSDEGSNEGGVVVPIPISNQPKGKEPIDSRTNRR